MKTKAQVQATVAQQPESFTIRFDEPCAANAILLDTNPWVDFTGDVPKLCDRVN